MPQQELNLLQFSTAVVTQLRACPPQVMRRDVLQAHSLATVLNYVPDHILRDALPPHLTHSGDRAKDSSLRNPRCLGPLIERGFDPRWNGNSTDVPALADQVHDCPVTLADLDLTQFQAHQFRSTKTTTKQHRQHGIVSLRSHAVAGSTLQYL
jgi:hypothetical protein